jgi:hypothetical protein
MVTSRKTAKTSTARTAPAKAAAKSSRAAAASGPDAIALLKADHKRVSDLYAQYEKTRSVAKKRSLVASICQELSVHAQVEDKEPDGELFDAKIKVMSEYTRHHVKEEQNEMFPKARKTRLDMNALGEQIAARKKELMASPELLEALPTPASPAMAPAA